MGSSQIIPYLAGLADKGHHITILSTEKKDRFYEMETDLKTLLNNHSINWHYIFYTKRPPVISTWLDIRKLKQKCNKLMHKHQFEIVHTRSYIASIVGLYLKKKSSIKFIFDMRGFYADERVDGNLWPQKNPIFRFIYKKFKKTEKQLLKKCDHVVSLTYAGADIIHKWDNTTDKRISIIPCCTDFDHFNFKNIDHNKNYKKNFNIEDNSFVLTYLGSIGTWYLLDEMLLFFKKLLEYKSDSVFLFITKDDPSLIQNTARRLNIDQSKIIIKSSNRDELPKTLSITDIAIFFIKPSFSKKASSPTKLAELMGMGIPVICNNIGDLDAQLSTFPGALVIEDLSNESFQRAVEKTESLTLTPKNEIHNFAKTIYDLNIGIERYHIMYENLQ
ncbi:MAG: hypothetical protein C0594_12230 [Marinilabiliales bacterium]|nr:MAG: hypothetical protein C0594_12230 [Marinilabiliales bacterium]